MTPLELLALAVALAMDAFAVSVAAGVLLREVSGRQTFRLAFHFGLFQALMPVLGWLAGLTIQVWVERYAPWIAFALLTFIAVRMIREAISDDDQLKGKEPTRGATMVMLSVATSIDALAVGVSMALLGVSVWFPALVIGVVACSFTAVGLHLGGYLGRRVALARYAGVVGGLVLLGIGVRFLVTS